MRVLPTTYGRKPHGIDMERNYVTITLCINVYVLYYVLYYILYYYNIMFYNLLLRYCITNRRQRNDAFS